MKRVWFIAVIGLIAAFVGYACTYLVCTGAQRSVEKKDGATLAWLQEEYHLTDTQFTRMRALHEAYQPKCMEMCHKIDEKNAELKTLLAATNVITPEIKQALAESVQLRVECQQAMLAHFYGVAQVMPPEQGRRYLAWVQQETLMPGQMPPRQSSPSSTHTP
jgi:Spy/CpxP family protein refolding chaperone